MENKSESRPQVAIIIVNWNAFDLTATCLNSIFDSDFPLDDLEVCVVDNGSADGSPKALRHDFPTVHLVELPKNLGFGAGVNAGIERTQAPVIVLVNNDATVEPHTITAFMSAVATANDTVAAITGLLVLDVPHRPATVHDDPVLLDHRGRRWVASGPNHDGAETLVNSTGNEVTRTGNGRDRDWLTPIDKLDAHAEVFGFCGGAVALRRKALGEVGTFDPGLFMYYEDTDLSWRLRRAGWTIQFCPKAIVRHKHAASSGTSSEVFLRYNARNRVLVSVRHAPSSVAWNALFRTCGRAIRGCGTDRTTRRRSLWILRHTAKALPAAFAYRLRSERQARVPRSDVARFLVAE